MNRHPFRRLVLRSAVLVVAFAALLVACGGGSPKSVAEDFYRAVEAGEISEALDMLADSTYDHIGRDKVRTALEMQTRRLADQGGIEDFEVVEAEVRGEIADLEVRITLGDGTVMNETVHLRKVDGRWKIEGRK